MEREAVTGRDRQSAGEMNPQNARKTEIGRETPRGGGADTQRRKGRRRQQKRKIDRPCDKTQTYSPPLPPGEEAHLHSLVEDITCSVCLDDLQEPVSIACGHTFCRRCISKHWALSRPQDCYCPECRAVCPKNQLAPDYRLGSLIGKIQLGLQEKNTKEERPMPPVSEYPIQLVRTDGDGCLQLNESALYDCFLRSEISSYPVLVLSVIGEKRRGKSFLMNYIIRALRSQERGEEFNLGADDEPLQGFEWKSGTDSTTKGIWIWSRPFILEQNGDKLAVYVLDTEGSLDIEGDRETSIKLSALSMLLSSHLIFNVASNLKETELDYMEMYLHMGDEYSLHHLQKLQKSNKYPMALWALDYFYTRCFLLPNPGKGITRDGLGRLTDMDEDFRESLRAYVWDVVRGAGHHTKTDSSGTVLTCAEICEMLQIYVEILQQNKYGFSSPMEMFYTIKNQHTMEIIQKEFQDFLESQSSLMLPSTMRTLVSEKSSELIHRFAGSLVGPNTDHHGDLLNELVSHLLGEEKKFCTNHTSYLTRNAIGLGLTVGLGVYGVVGTATGTAVLAKQAVATGNRVVGMEVAAGAVSMLRTGATALVGRLFRGGL
ncbi:RING finger protein 112-like isoform X2 [Ascaphus truei]|uniref:RING finger protein 112-like isoform X2 n=1 Tax=Ascaphus truei TaxID=8439 RepID=UPI003F5A7497